MQPNLSFPTVSYQPFRHRPEDNTRRWQVEHTCLRGQSVLPRPDQCDIENQAGWQRQGIRGDDYRPVYVLSSQNRGLKRYFGSSLPPATWAPRFDENIYHYHKAERALNIAASCMAAGTAAVIFVAMAFNLRDGVHVRRPEPGGNIAGGAVVAVASAFLLRYFWMAILHLFANNFMHRVIRAFNGAHRQAFVAWEGQSARPDVHLGR